MSPRHRESHARPPREESLHGPMPEEVTACLPNPGDGLRPQLVKSRRDWDFREGHIKSPAAFAAALLADASGELPSATGPHDPAKKKLIALLRRRSGEGRDELGLRELIGKAFQGLRDAKPETPNPRFRLNAEFVEWMGKLLPRRN